MAYTSTSFPIKKPETVIKAIKEMMEWLSQGKDVKSFAYTDPDDPNEFCSWCTVVRYMEDKEFIQKHGLACLPEQRQLAKSKGYAKWEKICEESARGDNEKANTASLQMVMRNKFGWDKKEEEKKEINSSFDDIMDKSRDAASDNS